MATATRRRSRATPQESGSARELVLAASKLMAERDSLDVSFVDIAEQAGLPQGLIGYYFGNKEGLLFAVLESSVGDALKELDNLLQSDLTPEEKMRLHLHGVVMAYFRAPFFNRLLQFMSRNASPERAAALTEQFIRPMTAAQERIIDEGVAAGIFRPIDKMLFFFATVGAADGLHASRFILTAVFGEELDAALSKRNAKLIVDVFMRFLLV